MRDALDWIDLSIGSVDYPHNPEVKRLAAASVLGHWPGYTDRHGIPGLREQVAARVNEKVRTSFSGENVLITSGSSMALQSLYQWKPATPVIVPNPGFPLYRQAPERLGMAWYPYRYRNWNSCLDDIDQAFHSGADKLIINSPGNPLGTIIPWSISRDLADMYKHNDGIVISDEAYADFTRTEEYRSPFEAFFEADAERCFYVGSFSKSFGLAAFRVGYIAHTNPKIIDALADCHWQIGMSVSWFGQRVAQLYLDNDSDRPAKLVAVINDNYARACHVLKQNNIPYLPAQGGIFLCLDLSGSEWSTEEALEYLQREYHLLVSSGTDFGDGADKLLRLNIAVQPDKLSAGLSRLTAFLKREAI